MKKELRPLGFQAVRRYLLFFAAFSFPVTMFFLSPVLPFESIFDEIVPGTICGSLIVFAVLLISALFFGRGFCGWLCPCGAIQETLSTFANAKPLRIKHPRRIQWLVFSLWLLGMIVALIMVGGATRLDLAFHTHFGRSMEKWGEMFIIYFVVSTIVLGFNLLVGKRGFCHTLCWMAPFMMAGTALSKRLGLPRLHLAIQPKGCNGCARCNAVCPMGLDLKDWLKNNAGQDPACILCGNCAKVCPKSCLKLQIATPNDQQPAQ